MIYDYVTTPTEARNDMVSFYESVLMDELAENAKLTTPEAYLEEVRADAYTCPVDRFGNEIDKLILKACDQVSTQKALSLSYSEAKDFPLTFVELRK